MNTVQQTLPTAGRTSSIVGKNPLAAIDDALRTIFPTQTEETQLQKARHILGNSANALSDEELEINLTEFQHLINHWLDAFEHQLFDGMTLQQVLRER